VAEQGDVAARLPRIKLDTRFLQYLGPGLLVTVGFIDPGNWATNVAAGAQFGYSLLWVITLSTLMLILLQHMSAHLGIVRGQCLSEACREHLPPAWAWVTGVTAVAACAATALAEICGAAIGLQVLTGLPLPLGALLSGAIVAALIWRQKYHQVEHVIIGFVSIIGFCYLVQVLLVKPDWDATLRGAFTPHLGSDSLLLAMGMLGAVVMPHNMFLHSEIIQSRNWHTVDEPERQRLLRYEMLDTILSMGAGWLINSAMIVVAAAVFFRHHTLVTELQQAAATLRPLAGDVAGLLFAVALLCAGVSSSITAGLAGGTVFTGFLGKPTAMESPWFRAGVLVTFVPAVLILALPLDTLKLLVMSQVCLSVQLPFTVVALAYLTSSKRVMGRHANRFVEKWLLYATAAVVVGLNVLLLLQVAGVRF
jgi:manganese transport protein